MEQDLESSGWVVRRDFLGFGAVGAVLGILTWRAVMPPEPASDETLSVAEAQAQARTGRITLVDIRTPGEWDATGVGEHAHPLDMRRDDFISALQDLAPKDAPIALICARGVRSARLAADLREAGFTRIIDVPEGMIGSSAGPGWIAAGLPLKPHEGDE